MTEVRAVDMLADAEIGSAAGRSHSADRSLDGIAHNFAVHIEDTRPRTAAAAAADYNIGCIAAFDHTDHIAGTAAGAGKTGYWVEMNCR